MTKKDKTERAKKNKGTKAQIHETGRNGQTNQRPAKATRRQKTRQSRGGGGGEGRGGERARKKDENKMKKGRRVERSNSNNNNVPLSAKDAHAYLHFLEGGAQGEIPENRKMPGSSFHTGVGRKRSDPRTAKRIFATRLKFKHTLHFEAQQTSSLSMAPPSA